MSIEFANITLLGGIQVEVPLPPSVDTLIVKESYPNDLPAYVLLENNDAISTE